jgi:hypothetical protein
MFLHPRGWQVLAQVALAGILISLSACKSKPPEAKKIGQTITGKVTYKGDTVPYGFVLLYDPAHSVDRKTGMAAPTCVGMIQKDGSYKLQNAPSGWVAFCVACDPDIKMDDLLRPRRMGMGNPDNRPGQPGGPGGGRPGAPGRPPAGPPGGPPSGPPGVHPGGPPGVGDNLPEGMPKPGDNPMAEKIKLTKEQKKMLKEIHEKYGSRGKSPIHREIEVGEQTIDLKLK